MPLRPSHPSLREICLFTRQLATLIRTGLPILSALTTLRQQTASVRLQQATQLAHATLMDGGSLAQGLAASPTIFSPLYTSLVASGEQAGILDHTLSTLAKSLERTRALRSRMLRAALYPCLVLTTLTIVTLFLLCWVIPTFEDLFSESGAQLPWLTRTVLDISRLLCDYWSYALAAIGCLVLWVPWAMSRSTATIRLIEQLSLSIPLAAKLIRARLAAEFATLLSALIDAGIPILEALTITANTVQHHQLASELRSARCALSEGLSLADSLKRSCVLPSLVAQMVSVGEASGQLAEMLAQLGVLYEEEVDTALKTLHDLAEPVLVILMGVVVGTLVVAIYLPLFQIGQLSGAM